jgi:hypothetical protein
LELADFHLLLGNDTVRQSLGRRLAAVFQLQVRILDGALVVVHHELREVVVRVASQGPQVIGLVHAHHVGALHRRKIGQEGRVRRVRGQKGRELRDFCLLRGDDAGGHRSHLGVFAVFQLLVGHVNSPLVVHFHHHRKVIVGVARGRHGIHVLHHVVHDSHQGALVVGLHLQALLFFAGSSGEAQAQQRQGG